MPWRRPSVSDLVSVCYMVGDVQEAVDFYTATRS
jgi:hypothetical protein